MPKLQLNGIELYYEEAGSGFPLVFCHEFAGDMRSWEPQVRYFLAAIASSHSTTEDIRHPAPRRDCLRTGYHH